MATGWGCRSLSCKQRGSVLCARCIRQAEALAFAAGVLALTAAVTTAVTTAAAAVAMSSSRSADVRGYNEFQEP